MANVAEFNSAKCTWPTTSTVLGVGLLDASFAQSGADVDLSVTTSTTGEGRPGIRQKELSVTVLGTSTASRGDTGIAKIIFGTTADNAGIWGVGSTGGARAYISSKSVSGAKDGAVTTAFTFKPRKSS